MPGSVLNIFHVSIHLILRRVNGGTFSNYILQLRKWVQHTYGTGQKTGLRTGRTDSKASSVMPETTLLTINE